MREAGVVTARGEQDWGDWDRADEKGLTRMGQRTRGRKRRGWKRHDRGKDGSGRRRARVRSEGRWWIAAIRGKR